MDARHLQFIYFLVSFEGGTSKVSGKAVASRAFFHLGVDFDKFLEFSKEWGTTEFLTTCVDKDLPHSQRTCHWRG